MSRIGKLPITVPAGVSVVIESGVVKVSGSKGNLELTLMDNISATLDGATLTIAKKVENIDTQKSHGLMRTLINNMIIGVSEGYNRQLEINGVGYRASVAGSKITLALGFSHPVLFDLPIGVTAAVDKNIITISGYDKQQVGQVAANIRALKKPEPYKGKGIKFIEERIRRKAGKTAAKG